MRLIVCVRETPLSTIALEALPQAVARGRDRDADLAAVVRQAEDARRAGRRLHRQAARACSASDAGAAGARRTWNDASASLSASSSSALERRGDLHARARAKSTGRTRSPRSRCREAKAQGPALLFENVRGAAFPLAMNVLAARGGSSGRSGARRARSAPSSRRSSTRCRRASSATCGPARHAPAGMLASRPQRVGRGPAQDAHARAPDLEPLPDPAAAGRGDGGRFVTFAAGAHRAIPTTRKRNLGIYRMHVLDAAHDRHALADPEGRRLPLSRGGDARRSRSRSRSRSAPIPPRCSRRSRRCPRASTSWRSPGSCAARRRRLARARTIDDAGAGRRRVRARRRGAARRAPHRRSVRRSLRPLLARRAVPGVPRARDHAPPAPGLPGERGRQAAAGGQVRWARRCRRCSPACCKVIHPEVVDLWAYFEAGFHNLLVVAVDNRFAKEAMKTALGLLGTGQLSLTKCVRAGRRRREPARPRRGVRRDRRATSIRPRTCC